MEGAVEVVDASQQVLLVLAAGNVLGYVDVELNRSRTATAIVSRTSSSHPAAQASSFSLATSPSSFLGGFDATPSMLSSSPHLSMDILPTAPGHAGAGSATSSLEGGAHASLAVIGSEDMKRMNEEKPAMALKFMRVLLKQAALELSNLPVGAS
uniref:Cyclic nucleotide-binding domain-containing protein n=1 Tax=Rhizochromulina marina TaxID=1034831 RepID=A0A7S2WVJ1_9STRA